MTDPNYLDNISDKIALITIDEQNMPSSDVGSDSEDEMVKEPKVCKWITEFEDVSVVVILVTVRLLHGYRNVTAPTLAVALFLCLHSTSL